MIDYLDILILCACGIAGGFLSGLLGVGGGIAYVVFISFYLQKLGVNDYLFVPAVIANSMFCIFFAGLSGSIKQYLNQNFHPKPILITGLASTFAAIFFSYSITHWLDYNRGNFTFIFILLLLFIAIIMLLKRDKENKLEEKPIKNTSIKFLGIGILSGSLAAFSGIGGGIIMMPLFTNTLSMNIKKANAVSLGVITLMAFLTSIYNMILNPAYLDLPYSIGLISLQISLPIAIFSVIAAPFGVSLASKLKPNTIRIIFVLFILAVIIRMVSGYF